MARLKEDVHEIRGALTEQREVIDEMARDFSRFITWVTIRLGWVMDREELPIHHILRPICPTKGASDKGL
ncbi:hypothetical protein Tco_0310769, partial [Tanacetum coccineum]